MSKSSTKKTITATDHYVAKKMSQRKLEQYNAERRIEQEIEDDKRSN